MTSLLQRGSPQHNRDVAAPASTLLEVSRAIAPAGGCSVLSCNWTFDTQKASYCQTQKNANFQAVHTVSVEYIFIIVIGSYREVRSQEVEKRNQILEGLTRIRIVAIGLLKQKK